MLFIVPKHWYWPESPMVAFFSIKPHCGCIDHFVFSSKSRFYREFVVCNFRFNLSTCHSYIWVFPLVAFCSDVRIADEMERNVRMCGSARNGNRIALFASVFVIEFFVQDYEIYIVWLIFNIKKHSSNYRNLHTVNVDILLTFMPKITCRWVYVARVMSGVYSLDISHHHCGCYMSFVAGKRLAKTVNTLIRL